MPRAKMPPCRAIASKFHFPVAPTLFPAPGASAGRRTPLLLENGPKPMPLPRATSCFLSRHGRRRAMIAMQARCLIARKLIASFTSTFCSTRICRCLHERAAARQHDADAKGRISSAAAIRRFYWPSAVGLHFTDISRRAAAGMPISPRCAAAARRSGDDGPEYYHADSARWPNDMSHHYYDTMLLLPAGRAAAMPKRARQFSARAATPREMAATAVIVPRRRRRHMLAARRHRRHATALLSARIIFSSFQDAVIFAISVAQRDKAAYFS